MNMMHVCLNYSVKKAMQHIVLACDYSLHLCHAHFIFKDHYFSIFFFIHISTCIVDAIFSDFMPLYFIFHTSAKKIYLKTHDA